MKYTIAPHNRLLIFFVALSAITFCGGYSSAKNKETKSDPAKSDYIFLEALRERPKNNADAYFELVSRAYELNPDDDYLGLEYSIGLMKTGIEDSLLISKSYETIRRYVRQNPDDIYNAALFASIASAMGNNRDALMTWKKIHELNPDRPEAVIQYAKSLAGSRSPENIELALALYDSLEISQGPSIPLSAEKMQIHLMQRDTTALVGEARRLLKTSPDNVEFNVFMGDIAQQFVSPDSSIKYYDRALEIDPSDGFIYYARARHYRAAGDSVAYDREVFNALRQQSLDIDPKLAIMREYVSELYSDPSQQPRISDLFGVLLQQHPHEAEIHNLYYDYLIAIGDYESAAEQAEYSLNLDPSEEKGWVALASLDIQNEKYDRAVDAAIRGLQYFPGNIQLYMLKATALNMAGNPGEAFATLRNALNKSDESDKEAQSDLMTAIGDIHYKEHNTDSAFIYYDKAIALNPDNLIALNNCAYYLACEDKDLSRAEQLITQALDERPDDPTWLDTYAWILFKKKEYAAAKEIIDKIMSEMDATTGSAEIFEHAGDIYFMNQLPDEAIGFWEEALELDPENNLLKRKVKNKTYFFK